MFPERESHRFVLLGVLHKLKEQRNLIISYMALARDARTNQRGETLLVTPVAEAFVFNTDLGLLLSACT
jgi:hypothetical protein